MPAVTWAAVYVPVPNDDRERLLRRLAEPDPGRAAALRSARPDPAHGVQPGLFRATSTGLPASTPPSPATEPSPRQTSTKASASYPAWGARRHLPRRPPTRRTSSASTSATRSSFVTT